MLPLSVSRCLGSRPEPVVVEGRWGVFLLRPFRGGRGPSTKSGYGPPAARTAKQPPLYVYFSFVLLKGSSLQLYRHLLKHLASLGGDVRLLPMQLTAFIAQATSLVLWVAVKGSKLTYQKK